jgi:hypothetical protein
MVNIIGYYSEPAMIQVMIATGVRSMGGLRSLAGAAGLHEGLTEELLLPDSERFFSNLVKFRRSVPILEKLGPGTHA